VFLERRTVSRKTAGDGRLEITTDAARHVERLTQPFVIDLAGESVPGALGTLACTCRGPAKPHVHYFLEAEQLKGLAAGSGVDIELEAAANRVIIRPAPPDA
jgi:hypothetical protein